MQINKMIVNAIIFSQEFWNVYEKVILFWFNMHERKIIIVATLQRLEMLIVLGAVHHRTLARRTGKSFKKVRLNVQNISILCLCNIPRLCIMHKFSILTLD